ncbi:oligosaccharide flippase family protein [Kineococcus sp. LSe6-4]|uniref:Oligosaccharide flippase family protein n=1 Tax=Kineococcus halophytocola TaxID=3234027 RepID=A0ABV4H106_9ACTN
MSAATPARLAGPPGAEPPGAEPAGAEPAGGPAGEDRQDEAQRQASGSTLFGRGLLYVVVAGAQLVSSAFASPVLAHVLGDPAALGTLALAVSLHQLLMAVVLLGLDHALVLRFAQDGHDRAARSLAGAALLVATAATSLVWVTAGWWGPVLGFTDRPVLLLTVLWTVPTAGVFVALGLLLAADRLRPYALVTLLSAVGGQVLGVVLVLAHVQAAGPSGVTRYVSGLLVADAVGAVVGLCLTRPRWRGALSWPALAPAVAFGVPLVLNSLSGFVLNAGDRIVLQRLTGPAEVGRYQIAYTVGYVATQVIGLTSSTWTPRFAAVADRVRRAELIGATRDTIYRLLSPVVLGIVLGAPVVLRVIAPATFEPAGLLAVVYVVVLSAYAGAAGSASGRMLVIERRTRLLAVVSVAVAALNIGLNLVLVPFWGILGAAVATLLAFCVQSTAQRWCARGLGAFPRAARRVHAEIVLVSAVAGATVLLPQDPVTNGVRFALALACLPWCFVLLRRVRRAV